MGNKLKIKARARKANAAHGALDDDELPVAAAQLGRIGRRDHGEIRVAPYPKACPARAVLDREPLRRAAARLEFRSNASVTRREQRGRARTRPVRRPNREARGRRPPSPSGRSPPANTTRSASRPTRRRSRKSRAAFAISGAPRSELGASSPPSLTVLPSASATSRRSSTLAAWTRPAGCPQAARPRPARTMAERATQARKEPRDAAAPDPCAATGCARRKFMLRALPRDGRRV